MTLDEHLEALATLHGNAVAAMTALQEQTDRAFAESKAWSPAERQVLTDWLNSHFCDDDE